jgi:hypothetical protein
VPPQTLRPFCLCPPKSLFLGNRDRLDQRLLLVAMLFRNGGPGRTKQHVSEQVFSRRRNAQAGNSRTLISRVAVTSAYEAGITATRVCVGGISASSCCAHSRRRFSRECVALRSSRVLNLPRGAKIASRSHHVDRQAPSVGHQSCEPPFWLHRLFAAFNAAARGRPPFKSPLRANSAAAVFAGEVASVAYPRVPGVRFSANFNAKSSLPSSG